VAKTNDRMMDRTYKVFVGNPASILDSGSELSRTVDVYILESNNGGDFEITASNDGLMQVRKLDDYEACKPFIRVPRELGIIMAKAFADFLNSNGIKDTSKDFDKGRLTQMEKHLDDMRKLVFKDNK
jgi:hypothetical protein